MIHIQYNYGKKIRQQINEYREKNNIPVPPEYSKIVMPDETFLEEELLMVSSLEFGVKDSLSSDEIKRIIAEQRIKAEKILKTKKKDLISLAEALVKYETLDKEQVEKIIKGESIENNEEKKENKTSNLKLSIANFDVSNLSKTEENKKEKEEQEEEKENIEKQEEQKTEQKQKEQEEQKESSSQGGKTDS